jgi:hypothetical protein
MGPAYLGDVIQRLARIQTGISPQPLAYPKSGHVCTVIMRDGVVSSISGCRFQDPRARPMSIFMSHYIGSAVVSSRSLHRNHQNPEVFVDEMQGMDREHLAIPFVNTLDFTLADNVGIYHSAIHQGFKNT